MYAASTALCAELAEAVFSITRATGEIVTGVIRPRGAQWTHDTR